MLVPMYRGYCANAYRITECFIFDMRALWPEELVTAGHIRQLLTFSEFNMFEKYCLKDAAAVVTLTHASTEFTT